MAQRQQENKNHVPWCTRAEVAVAYQDDFLSFHEKRGVRITLLVMLTKPEQGEMVIQIKI